jgi:signal transduction histidine kinase/ActR/RegA family two-component response regulator
MHASMPPGRTLSLRLHLLLLIGVVALPLIAFSAFMADAGAEQQQRAVEAGLVDTSRAMAVAIDSALVGSIAALNGLATSQDLDTGDLAAFRGQAQLLRELQPAWYSVWLADADGRQVMSLARPDGEALPSLADREYFATVMRTRQPAISGLLESRVTQGHHIAVAVPVIRDGAVRYVLVAGYRPEGFGAILTRGAPAPNATVSVVDRDFRVLNRTRDLDRWLGRRATDAYIDAIRRRGSGIARSMSLEGAPVYVAVHPVASSGWTVGIGVPADVIEGPRRRRLAVIALLGATVLALALAIAHWLGRRIVDAIGGAASAAEALVHGAEPQLGPSNVRELVQLNRALEDAAALMRDKERARQRLERDRQVMLEQAQSARAEAEAASRAKDEFLAMFGHELRNPLAALSSAIHVLAARPLEPDDAHKVHAIMRRQTDHLTHLVDDLLDVARLVRGKVTLHRTRVNLGRVLRQALDCTHEQAEVRQHALAVTERGAVWVDGDETRLLQIVVNLVDNAIKYTPAGGHIAMRLGRESDTAVLTVQDDGPGIAPDLLPHVFELFTQGERPLDRGQGGLGLGLNIARRLAELHGGSIEAHSEPGHGARFTVRLPAASPPAHGVHGERTVDGRRRKVLVVEDNDDVREMLRTALECDGHEVRTAADGPAALALLARWSPDVALLDIGLPGMDGYELARALRGTPQGRRLALIAVTGYAATSDRRRAEAAGFDAHLSKPVDPRELADVLERRPPQASR